MEIEWTQKMKGGRRRRNEWMIHEVEEEVLIYRQWAPNTKRDEQNKIKKETIFNKFQKGQRLSLSTKDKCVNTRRI